MTMLLLLAFQVVNHEFVYEADRDRRSVHVAGTFNNWDRSATAMSATSGRVWRAKVTLPPGKHLYKFVLDGEEWIVDPRAKKNEDDGNGNTNSVLMLVPGDYAVPASRTDGTIAKSALHHEMRAPAFNYDRGHLTFTLRTRAGDAASAALVVGKTSYPMTRQGSDDLYDTYRTRLPWDGKTALAYRFSIRDGKEHHFGSYRVDPKVYRPFVVPARSSGKVFYQIFPERFANGSTANDPAETVAWDAAPKYFNFMGGDLAGIRSTIGYLDSLGVDGIYLNPIFEGPSNHGYETEDYHRVAKRFGTNEEFRDLVSEFHGKRMQVVLDGVFNHTAVTFKQFQDIREKGRESRFVDWYWIRSFPVVVADPPNYTAWFNFPSMPKVNLSNPEARKFFLAIPAFWKRTANIDGWRLDVANEVAPDYWRDFRKAVKAADPNGWIVGEVWGDGSSWLGGDQWDSIMGYQFRDAALRFVAEGKTTPSQFLGQLMRVYDSYAPQVSRNLMNLLSSHDTPRFLTLCGGDRSLALLGATLQLTWPGSPSIYYGEELGMMGGADPENRRGMEWHRNTADNPFLAHYRRLLQIRQGSRALQEGDPAVLATNDADGTLAFGRFLGGHGAIVAANRSGTARSLSISTAKLPKELRSRMFKDELSGAPVRSARGSIVVTLAPRSAAVLLPTSVAQSYLDRDASRLGPTFRLPNASLGELR